VNRDRLIWLFAVDVDLFAIHGPIADTGNCYIQKILNLVFYLIVKTIMYSMTYFFSKTSKIKIYELKFFNLQQFKYFAMIFN